jgi:hypothetical protein
MPKDLTPSNVLNVPKAITRSHTKVIGKSITHPKTSPVEGMIDTMSPEYNPMAEGEEKSPAREFGGLNIGQNPPLGFVP